MPLNFYAFFSFSPSPLDINKKWWVTDWNASLMFLFFRLWRRWPVSGGWAANASNGKRPSSRQKSWCWRLPVPTPACAAPRCWPLPTPSILPFATFFLAPPGTSKPLAPSTVPSVMSSKAPPATSQRTPVSHHTTIGNPNIFNCIELLIWLSSNFFKRKRQIQHFFSRIKLNILFPTWNEAIRLI